mgnify:CR=1 FL=1
MSFITTSTLKNSTIMFLYSERERINLAPEYQRSGGVWTLQKRRLLIDSILNDYDIPKIYFHSLSAPGKPTQEYDYAVIDGRQRMETIWSYIDGEFALSDDFEYQLDQSLNLAGLTYEDLAKSYPRIRIKFDSFVLPVVSVETDDIDLIEDMFSRLNEAVPLNAAEKRNAIGGNLVKAIRAISAVPFFEKKVAFGSGRAQHLEVSARMLLTEHSLQYDERIIDTKREYLDALAREFKNDRPTVVTKLERGVKAVLKEMSNVFMDGDPLLRAQGNMVVYFLLFRGAMYEEKLSKITRRKLLNFRDKLAENRSLAEEDFVKSDFALLEYDRLSQQGTNDASNIRERYEVLADHMGLPPTYHFG